MQRAIPRYRIYAAAFVAAIATVVAAPSLAASGHNTKTAAHYFCPPIC